MSAQVSADGQLEMRQLEMRTVRNEYWVYIYRERERERERERKREREIDRETE